MEVCITSAVTAKTPHFPIFQKKESTWKQFRLPSFQISIPSEYNNICP